jgi:hypothetical protein
MLEVPKALMTKLVVEILLMADRKVRYGETIRDIDEAICRKWIISR